MWPYRPRIRKKRWLTRLGDYGGSARAVCSRTMFTVPRLPAPSGLSLQKSPPLNTVELATLTDDIDLYR